MLFKHLFSYQKLQLLVWYSYLIYRVPKKSFVIPLDINTDSTIYLYLFEWRAHDSGCKEEGMGNISSLLLTRIQSSIALAGVQ